MSPETRKPRPTGNRSAAISSSVQPHHSIPTAAAESAFAAAMAEAGIVTADPIVADGQLHRIHIDGHKRGSKNGAYVLHGDGRAAGWFSDFVTGLKATWKAESNWKPDPDAKKRMEAVKVQRQAEEHARHMEAASRAALIWEQATDCDSHPYLAKKRVKAWGLRARGNDLLIPLRDSWGPPVEFAAHRTAWGWIQ